MEEFLSRYIALWQQAGVDSVYQVLKDFSVENIRTRDVASSCMSGQLELSLQKTFSQASPFKQFMQSLEENYTALPWTRGGFDMPDSFKDRYAFIELIGPYGMIRNLDIACGVYVQMEDTLYPSHQHSAEEDYIVISGTARWQADKAEFTHLPPASHIHHTPHQPHAMHTTLEEALLAFWFWQGDLSIDTYEIDGKN